MSRLRLRAISCEVLARPVYMCAARSPHVVDVTLLRRRLHDTPVLLRERLQAGIDAASEADPPYDAVVLAYGLCGGASAGVTAAGVPLVVPRAHDCITLLLGSRDRYEREFAAHPGTYWYAPDYLERSDTDDGGTSGGLVGIGATTDEAEQAAYAEYVERFGEDNAAYLMEVSGAWRSHYDRAAFLDTGVGDTSSVEEKVRLEAQRRGWQFERLAGKLVLIRRLLDGDWDEDFLVLQPGQRLAMSYDTDIVRAQEAPADSQSAEGHAAR
ncbi:MAG: DUF1638 domain-containing protein [Candidatus Limnocylindrales bacterium]